MTGPMSAEAHIIGVRREGFRGSLCGSPIPLAMDPSDFVRMYRFLVDARERYLGKIRQVGWEEIVTDRGGT